MLSRLALAFALCLAALAAPGVRAATLPVPSVEYSADRVMETEAGTFTGKVYSARGKERQEMSMQGMQTVTILRHDKKLGYMLMPMQRMYREMDLAAAQKQSGSQGADQVEITEVGPETVEGHATTKYKMLMKDGSGGGFIWITSDGIAVKMDMLSKSGGRKSRVAITLTNLKIGAQDPQVFEVPADYKPMPSFGGMSGLSGLGGAAKGMLPGGR